MVECGPHSGEDGQPYMYEYMGLRRFNYSQMYWEAVHDDFYYVLLNPNKGYDLKEGYFTYTLGEKTNNDYQIINIGEYVCGFGEIPKE